MENVYIRQLFLKPPKIFGKQLQPLSIFHVIILSAFDNPFIVGGRTETKDLLLALLVCMDQYDPETRNLLPTLAKFDKGKFLIWKLSLYLRNHEDAMDSFEEYISDYCDAPEYWSAGGEASRVFWAFNLLSCLMSSLPAYNAKQIWNMPLTEALCHKARLNEENGAKLVDQEEMKKAREQIDLLNERLKEKLECQK